MSYRPDLHAVAVDAFTLTWPKLTFCAFPPFSLVANVLSKIKNEKARGVCVLPKWTTQPWYAKAMEMLEKPPIHLKASKDLLRLPMQSSGRDTRTVQKVTSHGLSPIRKSIEFQNLYAPSTDIIMASCGKGTKKQYMSYLVRWREYCKREHIEPHNPGKIKTIEFLRALYEEGLGYSAINTARSALSSVTIPNGGITFGRDPLVCRSLKGIFELKPCLP